MQRSMLPRMIRPVLPVLILAASLSLSAQRSTGGPPANPRPVVSLPDETGGLDQIVTALVASFDQTDIVALGESHGRKLDSELRIRLVREPGFARKVQVIVVEFWSGEHQKLLDRYIDGEDVPILDLQQVWKDRSESVWQLPVYAEFFAAVRDVNTRLPPGGRIRILGGNPSASLLKDVLDRGAKALAIYGSGHLTYFDGDITRALQASHPGRTFVVGVAGGKDPEFEGIDRALKSPTRPVLFALTRPPFQEMSGEFLGRGNKLLVNGVWVDVNRYRSLSLGQLFDALIYLAPGDAE